MGMLARAPGTPRARRSAQQQRDRAYLLAALDRSSKMIQRVLALLHPCARWPNLCRARITCSRRVRRRGGTIVVYSSAPASQAPPPGRRGAPSGRSHVRRTPLADRVSRPPRFAPCLMIVSNGRWRSCRSAVARCISSRLGPSDRGPRVCAFLMPVWRGPSPVALHTDGAWVSSRRLRAQPSDWATEGHPFAGPSLGLSTAAVPTSTRPSKLSPDLSFTVTTCSCYA